MRTRAALAALLTSAFVPALHAQSTRPAAIVTALPMLPGYSFVFGAAVNASGQVAGNATEYNPTYSQMAIITGPAGTGVRGLGTPSGYESSTASALSASGQVAGTVSKVGGFEAFLTGPDGQGLRTLGFLPGGNSSSANGVNAFGQVTGLASTTSGYHAFLTGSDGQGMRDLGVLPGFGESWGNALNASGQVAGRLTNVNTEEGQVPDEAFLTGPGGVGMRALGFLPGRTSSIANAVNASGQVAGISSGFGLGEAFVTDVNGQNMQGLGFGRITDAFGSRANGIDDAGRVVGSVAQSVGSTLLGFGFVYTPGVGLQLLDDLLGDGWRITDATAISATAGYVVVNGSNAGLGITNTSLLIRLAAGPAVVPEPGTWALLGTGLLVMGAAARRRRTRA